MRHLSRPSSPRRWPARGGGRCPLVTGGLGGVMQAASHGAARAGGIVIAVLPGTEPDDATPDATVVVATGVGHRAQPGSRWRPVRWRSPSATATARSRRSPWPAGWDGASWCSTVPRSTEPSGRRRRPRRPSLRRALSYAPVWRVGQLDRPAVAVGIGEEHELPHGKSCTSLTSTAARRQLVMRGLDVLDDELRPCASRERASSCPGRSRSSRRSRRGELDEADLVADGVIVVGDEARPSRRRTPWRGRRR